MEEKDNSCGTACREEFRCAKLGFGYKYPVHFVTSQFGSPLLYPIWTIFVLVYHMSFVIAMIIIDSEEDSFPDDYWFIFFTNIGYLILNIAFFWDFIVTQYLHVTDSKILHRAESKMPWYLMVDWLLFNIKNAVGLAVTIGYYTLFTIQLTAVSTEKHAINSVFIVLDLFLSAKPVRFLHVYQPILATLAYILFSFVYQRTGHAPVYDILDWDKNITFGYAFGLAFITIPLVHFVLFGLYHFRLLLYRCMCMKRRDMDTEVKMNDIQKY